MSLALTRIKWGFGSRRTINSNGPMAMPNQPKEYVDE